MRHPRLRPPCRRRARGSRLTIIALLFLIVPTVARSESDTPLLKDVLESIARTGVRLIYSSEIVPTDLRVRGPPRGSTAAEQLQSILAPLSLVARPLPGGFVIVPARRVAAALYVSVASGAGASGHPIVGALISIPHAGRSTRTNRLGEAELADLAPATYVVRIHADGFRTETRSIRIEPVDGDSSLKIQLEPDLTMLDQVVVETSRYDVSATLSASTAREALESNPVTSSDAARSLQLLPGSATAGYTARTHARGSRDDETLFRYDGVTLNDPYHLKAVQSLFSAIDPVTVESVTAWTGTAPIQFGGRLGAVVDIEPRIINIPTYDVKASQQTVRLLLGTPFGDQRGSIFASARVGNSLSPAGWIDRETGPSFNDLVVRATWAFGPRTRVAAGILAIEDQRVSFGEGGVRETVLSGRELYTWLRLTHAVSASVNSETLVSTEDSYDYIRGSINQPGIAHGFLNERDRHFAHTVREDLTISPARRWSVRLGAELTTSHVDDQATSYVTFDAPFIPTLQPSAPSRPDFDFNDHALTKAVYGGLRWQATDSTIVDAGLRRERRDFTSVASDGQWNFRANMRHQISKSTTIRIGWGQVSQADVFDATSAADGTIQPAAIRRLTHSNISLEYNLPSGWLLRTEAYDKREGTPMATNENAFSQFTLLPELGVDRQLILTQQSRMRGVEVLLESDRSQALTGTVSYAWSRTEDLIAGRWTPRSWDQPHAIQLGALWRRGSWYVVGVVSWHSGWPYTPSLASSTHWTDPATVTLALAPRNSVRLENYRSVDLRLTWEHPWGNGIFQAFLDAYNVTNSMAACCRSYSVARQADGSSFLVQSQSPWLVFTPVFGIRWRH